VVLEQWILMAASAMVFAGMAVNCLLARTLVMSWKLSI
jgi:hypothetical protein